MIKLKKKLLLKNIGIIMIIIISFSSCDKYKQEDTYGLNVYVDTRDDKIIDIINYIKQEYELENENIKINLINSVQNEEINSQLIKNNIDILFTNRNHMIELSNKGVLTALTEIVRKNKIDQNYYDISTLYGKYNNEIYGIGVIPFSIEIYYNNKFLEKNNINAPQSLNDLYEIMKLSNQKGIKIPVVIPYDVNINELIFSEVVNNLVNLDKNKVEQIYGSNSKYIEINDDMKKSFDYINNLYKLNIINKDTFQIFNEAEYQDIENFESPVVILTNNYSELNENILNYSLIDYNKLKIKNTIIVEPIICLYSDNYNKNNKQIDDFIKYIYSEKFQKKLKQKGFTTSSIEVNKDLGIDNKINDLLYYANDRNIYFTNNIPKIVSDNINKKIQDILSGNYDGNEWSKIIDNVKNK